MKTKEEIKIDQYFKDKIVKSIYTSSEILWIKKDKLVPLSEVKKYLLNVLNK